VRPHVFQQAERLCERLSAQLARERLFAGVSSYVSRQIVRSCKTFTALATQVSFRPVVHLHVPAERAGAREPLIADFTNVSAHFRVRLRVGFQVDHRRETLSALLAWINGLLSVILNFPLLRLSFHLLIVCFVVEVAPARIWVHLNIEINST
jgi:hypothetical protein